MTDSIKTYLFFSELMTHIIADKKFNQWHGFMHKTAVDGLDRVDINNRLHYLNVEMDKLKAKQAEFNCYARHD